MLITCPECGGRIPDTERTCPICGNVSDTYSVAPVMIPEEEVPQQEIKTVPKKSIVAVFFRRIWELILFLVICTVVILIVLLTDFCGARTSLRQMCMTDSGSGSASDSQILRVEVKHHILFFLNLIDNGGDASTAESGSKKNPVKITFPEAKEKKEREPLKLPPEPPKLKTFDEVYR